MAGQWVIEDAPGQWVIEDEPVQQAPKRGFGSQFLEDTKQTVLAGLHGASNIGSTLLSPTDAITGNTTRRADTLAGLKELGYDENHWGGNAAKLATEIAGTAGAGGVIAGGLKSIPMVAKYATPLLETIASSGMVNGGTKGMLGVANRVGGGAITGGAMAGMINPDDAGTGAVIGGAAPVVLQIAGKAGMAAYNAYKGNKPGAGALLAKAMNVNEADLPKIIKALESAPESIIPGSNLTVNQALQLQGANQPGAKMLERIVAGGPGGDPLLKRYADQGAARINELQRHGAQTYQGAAREESNMLGNRIGATLRTQAGDDKAAAREVWEKLYKRGADEGVALQLPIDQMKAAMGPLGRGSVVKGVNARAVLNEADNIGYMELPAVKLTPAKAAKTQSLEQAVRSQGGIHPDDILAGEVRGLTNKQSGTTGLVTKFGKSSEELAQTMFERGFIPDNDPATLLASLQGGQGRKIFANDISDDAFARQLQQSMGDPPAAERVLQAVPFDEFQRLRRDSGKLAARAAEHADTAVEGGVLSEFQGLLAGRADDAAMGNLLPGERMSPDFMTQYNTARELTKRNAELYNGGNNISSILRKPVGQDYALNGDEITNKVWHGGSGLVADVQNLRRTLSQENQRPVMDSLQKFILTDAASKTKGSGDLGAALPRYVESRMPGLQEVLTSDQLRSITGVASDIRNADAAGAVQGLLGSDTQAKITRALDGGLLDSSIAKTIGNVKGLGAVREKAAEFVRSYKGKTISDLMADPKAAALALADKEFSNSLPLKVRESLVWASRSAPVLSAQ
jgi:hypothetical protein